MLPWTEIDTVLLDMDGTLLDLNYDNTLWNEHVPAMFAALNDMTVAEAHDHLYGAAAGRRRKLDYYSLDYWETTTRLDIDALHRELKHLIEYRRNALAFLTRLQQTGRRAVIATNAHRRSLAVKNEVTDIVDKVDACHSAHDFGAPKEDRRFWEALALSEPFDIARTLFIDDNLHVLDAASDYGIRHLVTIAQPDSGIAPRSDLPYRAIGDFHEIMPDA